MDSRTFEEIAKRIKSVEDGLSSITESARNLKSTSDTDKKKLANLEYRLSQLEKAIETPEDDVSAPFYERLANRVTGIIGLKEVADSTHSVVKYTWILLFLMGVAATIFFTYQTASEYLSEPTATKVKLNSSSSYDLPAIAICPAPWIDTEKALALGLSINALKYSLGYVGSVPDLTPNETAKAKEDFLDFYSAYNFSSLVDYYKKISIDLETTYSTKEFNNMTMAIKMNDKKSVLIDKIYLHYQTCYAYYFAPTGRSLSTTAVASVKFYDKTKGIMPMAPDLWLHLKTELGLLYSPLSPVYAETSYRTRVLIHAQRLIVLNKADSVCCDQSPGNDSDSTCAARCVNKRYKAMIACQVFRYSMTTDKLSPWEACNSADKLDAFNNLTFGEFSTSEFQESVINDCIRKCPPKCDRTVYQMHIQWQQRLPPQKSENVSSSSSLKEPPKKQSFFEIYVEHAAKYDGETISFIEVNTYSFTELINNVGGTLGLFLGATLMTFAQLILFFIEHLRTCGRRYAVSRKT